MCVRRAYVRFVYGCVRSPALQVALTMSNIVYCRQMCIVYSYLFLCSCMCVCVCEIPWQECMFLMHACLFNPHIAESALKSTTKHMAYVCTIWSNQHGDVLGSAQLHQLFLTLKDFMVPCCTLREITFVAIHKTEDSSRFCKL